VWCIAFYNQENAARFSYYQGESPSFYSILSSRFTVYRALLAIQAGFAAIGWILVVNTVDHSKEVTRDSADESMLTEDRSMIEEEE